MRLTPPRGDWQLNWSLSGHRLPEGRAPALFADARPPLDPTLPYSNAKMRFQSFFMLMTVQPFLRLCRRAPG